nr:MAG TPA: hypothetical protein [Caudoviricetes sp.]
MVISFKHKLSNAYSKRREVISIDERHIHFRL